MVNKDHEGTNIVDWWKNEKVTAIYLGGFWKPVFWDKWHLKFNEIFPSQPYRKKPQIDMKFGTVGGQSDCKQHAKFQKYT